jgi:hypothetical protein
MHMKSPNRAAVLAIVDTNEETNMLIDARWQRHLVAALHLESLLKWGHKEDVTNNGRSAMNAYPAKHRSKEHDIDSSSRLSALLRHLGVSADIVEASIRRNNVTIARAAEIIAEWMTYLPEDCVKAMVNDGWHWSV